MDLLNCPFCGSEPAIVSGLSTTIRCSNDQCIIYNDVPLPFNDYGHQAAARAAWNRRAAVSDAPKQDRPKPINYDKNEHAGSLLRDAVRLARGSDGPPDHPVAFDATKQDAREGAVTKEMLQAADDAYEQFVGESKPVNYDLITAMFKAMFHAAPAYNEEKK